MHQFLLRVASFDLREGVGLAAQIIVRHTQEVLAALWTIEWVIFDLLDDVFNFVSRLDLLLALIHQKGFEPVYIDPDDHALEAV